MCRADLDPGDWDVAGIAAATNASIANKVVELSAPEVKTWSAELQAEQHKEFGALAAVDFFEQCVETGPSSAPWQSLQTRIEAGEFEGWPPVWTAQ
uniref:hypothetical protein n=1 Tax=Mycolicibacterium fortuitum TaxID=1766 RepID=UPI001CD87A55|nr:hypothetical protein [Mycolicibacterium fortuitum]